MNNINLESSLKKGTVKDRISTTAKNKNKKQWFKDKIDETETELKGFSAEDEEKRSIANFELYNGGFDEDDFKHILKPFPGAIGELPINFKYQSVLVPKLKVLEGLEASRPFDMKIFAINSDATTRKEEEQYNRIRDFVVSKIREGVRMQVEAAHQEELQNKELTNEQKQQLEQQIQEEEKKATPKRVAEFMETEYQDASEILSSQLFEYFKNKDNLEDLFSEGWRDILIDSRIVYYVGKSNDRPIIYKLDTKDVYHNGKNFFHDATKILATYYMQPIDIVSRWSDELTDKEIDDIYGEGTYYSDAIIMLNNKFEELDEYRDSYNSIQVTHCQWKSLTKIGFLQTIPEGKEVPEIILVSDYYRLNKEAGDISITWQWIDAWYEGFKINSNNPIYVGLTKVEWGTIDKDNIFDAKPSFVGADLDKINGKRTSLLERGKVADYMFNIVNIQIQKILSKDRGKVIAIDPTLLVSKDVSLSQALYYMEANGILTVNLSANGRITNVTDNVKVLDMSSLSDLQSYIRLAEFYRESVGVAVGVTPQMEGQIRASENVGNVKQAITQNTYMLEPYFRIFNRIKRDVCQRYLDVIKDIYSTKPPQKLVNILDDLSMKTLRTDPQLLANNQLGVFISNSSQAYRAHQLIEELSHAAIQNQAITMSSVAKIATVQSTAEKMRILDAAEKQQKEFQQQMQQQQQEAAKQLQDAAQAFELQKMDKENQARLEQIEAKGKIDLQRQAILSSGFAADADADDDGIPDIMEIYKNGVDADIKAKKLKLDQDKFKHKVSMDKKKLNQNKSK